MSGSKLCDELRSEVVHLLARLHPRHQLLVVIAFELCAFVMPDDAPWTQLLLLVEWQEVALLALLVCLEIRVNQSLRHDECHRLAVVEIVSLDGYVVNLRTHTESHVGWQGPRGCSPCDEVRLAPLGPLCLRILDEELHGSGEVFHVAIATWLVQLVGAQARTCAWGIWLDGVALV